MNFYTFSVIQQKRTQISAIVEGDHDEEVLCPQLEEVIGRLTGEQRWSRFLEAGSRTSKEFQEAWLTLTAEAISIFNFLEEEPSGPNS